MKEYFDKVIQPAVDRLEKTMLRTVITSPLGEIRTIHHIQVTNKDEPYTVPVKVTYTAHAGNRVTRKAGTRGLYEAMGLRI